MTPSPNSSNEVWQNYRASLLHEQSLNTGNGDLSLSVAAGLVFCISVYSAWRFNANRRARF